MDKSDKSSMDFRRRAKGRTRQQKVLTLAISAALLGSSVGVIGGAQAVDRTTEYDENRHARQNMWEAHQYEHAPNSITDLDDANPAPAVSVDRTNSVDAQSIYRRLEANKDNTEFGTFLDRVDRYEEVDIPEWDRRITALEEMEYWEAAPPATTDWITTGRIQETQWEPSTDGRTSDFTQTRWVRLAQEKRTHLQERNLDTGELRTVSTSVETGTTDIQESRQVKVAPTPDGQGSGWSEEVLVRSGYGCTDYSPSADTVAQGTTFDQSRTCYNDYQKNIYYLADGGVIDSDTDTRTASYREWRYNVAGTYVEPFTPGKACSEYPGARNTSSTIIVLDPARSNYLYEYGYGTTRNVWNYDFVMAYRTTTGRVDIPTDKNPDDPRDFQTAPYAGPGLFPGPVFKAPNTGAGPGWSYIACEIDL